MAEKKTLVCDSCGSDQDVVPLAAQRGSEKLVADLCARCWEQMVAHYALTQHKPRGLPMMTDAELRKAVREARKAP